MIPFLTEQFGNAASRSHAFGWEARRRWKEARGHVAALLNADSKEIIWTSGATEGNNLAIKGAANFYKGKGKHIVTMKTEHKAVLDTVRELERQGFESDLPRPGAERAARPGEVQGGVATRQRFFASVMMVNNEIGVIQPIAEIGEICRSKGIIFHCDAVQAGGQDPDRPAEAEGGSPDGDRAQGLRPEGHRRALRSQEAARAHRASDPRRRPRAGPALGDAPTHQIVGMGEAFRIAKLEMAAEGERIRALRDRLPRRLQGT